MLTAAQLEELDRDQPAAPAKKRQSPASLKQQYLAYIMQRIEDYKNSLPRDTLLTLGDVAAEELQSGSDAGQFLLTEVLMQEQVDKVIIDRLNLADFKKWKSKHRNLREAQRNPIRWQISPSDPVAVVLRRLEPGDRAVVIGGGAARAAFLLAAHDLEVTCIFSDNATADAVEAELSAESLSGQCEVLVGLLGGSWFPALPQPIHVVVLDAEALGDLEPERRKTLVWKAQQLTAPEGVHALVASDRTIAPEAFLSLYPDWQRLTLPPRKRSGKQVGLGGVLLSCPPFRARHEAGSQQIRA